MRGVTSSARTGSARGGPSARSCVQVSRACTSVASGKAGGRATLQGGGALLGVTCDIDDFAVGLVERRLCAAERQQASDASLCHYGRPALCVAGL